MWPLLQVVNQLPARCIWNLSSSDTHSIWRHLYFFHNVPVYGLILKITLISYKICGSNIKFTLYCMHLEWCSWPVFLHCPRKGSDDAEETQEEKWELKCSRKGWKSTYSTGWRGWRSNVEGSGSVKTHVSFVTQCLEAIEFNLVIQSHVNKEQIKRSDVFPSSMCSQLVNLRLPIDADSCCTVWFW